MRFPWLVLHITGGIIGLLSGSIAMVYRKGSRGHRAAGNVFGVSMLIMGLCGSILAVMKHQLDNTFGGLITFYLIATAWSTGRRRDQQTNLLDWGALVFAVVLGCGMITLGTFVALGEAAKQPGVPLGMYFFMGAIPRLAATGDLRMLVRGGVSGTPRLARHLWRMCFGLFIASGSFFLGKQGFFPAAVRKLYLLVPLAILPLVLLIYWLARVSLFKNGNASFFAGKRELRRAAVIHS